MAARQNLSGAAVSGSLTAVTAAAGDSSTTVATTAFVAAAIGTGGTYNPAAVAITGGSVNGATVGAGTAATGAFTSLNASTTFMNGSNTKATDTILVVNGAAATNRAVHFQSGGVDRFSFGIVNAAESGSNAGADFVLTGWTDTGGFLSDWIRVNRSAGAVTLNGSLAVNGSTTLQYVTATTPAAGDNGTALATTAFVTGATQGSVTINTTGGTTTLTAAQYSAPIQVIAGALTSNAILVAPNTGIFTVSNKTTGAFTLTVKTAAGTGYVVPQGLNSYLMADGANVVSGRTDLSNTAIATGTINSTTIGATTPSSVAATTITATTPISLASGGTGTATAAAARAALGLVAAGVTMQVATVSNGTVYFSLSAPYAGAINSLDYLTATGSFTLAVQVAGVSVTGLSAVAVSSATVTNAAATGSNTFTAGQTITGVISASASPSGAVLNLRLTKA